MNSTNVPSNMKNDQVNNPAPVCGQTIPTEGNGIEMPPKAASWGKSAYEVENGETIEIPVGNSRINENNILEMDNGNILDMKNPKAYQNVVSAKIQRDEMARKAKQKEAQAGVDR